MNGAGMAEVSSCGIEHAGSGHLAEQHLGQRGRQAANTQHTRGKTLGIEKAQTPNNIAWNPRSVGTKYGLLTG
jgi:hypothetical protein